MGRGGIIAFVRLSNVPEESLKCRRKTKHMVAGILDFNFSAKENT